MNGCTQYCLATAIWKVFKSPKLRQTDRSFGSRLDQTICYVRIDCSALYPDDGGTQRRSAKDQVVVSDESGIFCRRLFPCVCRVVPP